MTFDNSRFTFNPFNSYSSVVMPQGRVQLDADWNEFLAEIARRIQAGTLDTMGRAVYPLTTPDAFYISPSSTRWVVNIGQGRMYVDGVLAENHGPAPGTWDPALAELSGSPQPAPASISGTPSIPFTSQPYFPGATPPPALGSYVFYLDVWTRAVTWLQDPSIIDSAVGIDTSGRLQTVWQVRWLNAATASLPVNCGTPDANISYPYSSFGLLTNGLVPNTSTGPCCLTPGTGYTGLENQFYRIQIHQGGPLGTATFKWSRENASVATGVTGIATQGNNSGKQTTVLTVLSLGRDQVLNFSNGDWIELLNDDVELNGMPDPNYPLASPNIYGSPGLLCQIDYVDPTTNSIFLVAPPITDTSFPVGTPDPNLHTRIVRWDQSGTVYSTDLTGKQTATSYALSTGDIQTPADGAAMLVLENGLWVTFNVAEAGGNFLSGDFWTFAARTDGTLEPPPFSKAPPRGIHHHYTKLSVVTFDGSGNATNTPDCRTPWGWSDEGDCGCCTVTVGDNVTSFGTYTSIQHAIYNLPAAGGEVCILPGQYYESVVLSGASEVTLRGSGPQTILYAPSANPGGTADESGSTQTVSAESGINAIITVANSQGIKLTGFTVEAPAGMACILLDQISSGAQADLATAKQQSMEQQAKEFARKAMVRTAQNAGAGQKAVPAVEQQVNQTVTGASSGIAKTGGNIINASGIKDIPNYGQEYGGLGYYLPEIAASNTDVTLTDLVLTASNFPAIAAVDATLLNICDNRIFMQDVAGLWPAVYVSGAEITMERNWIGLQDNADAADYATAQVLSDLGTNFSANSNAPVGNGGIQIGGYSTDVAIVDNDIEGGAFNAITLGGILQMNGGTQVAGLNGLFLSSPVTSAGTTLVLPATSGNNQLAADGPLQNIRMERNRLSNIGLCGIGPVGFFTSSTPEIVSVVNLLILGNTLSGTLQATIAPFPETVTELGYGAICLADVQVLTVRDNVITDFGSAPGAQVCGIFVQNGEQVEISRNQVLETRDWASIPATPAAAINGTQAGIAIAMVTPPALNQKATAMAWIANLAAAGGTNTSSAPPLYEPGLPALRMDQNVVRVPLGYSVGVLGYGPFSITENQFSSGGTVPGGTFGIALTIFIVNLGMAIEFDTPTSFSSLWSSVNNPPTLEASNNALSNSSSGLVLFADNICQLENRVSGATGLASVVIFALDHLTFANNHTWIDGKGVEIAQTGVYAAAFMDAFLMGVTLQVVANRFQESRGSVVFSGLTAGLLNVTSQNISTFCLYSAPKSAAINNLSYCSTKKICDPLYKLLTAALRAFFAAAESGTPPPPVPPPGTLNYASADPQEFAGNVGIALNMTDNTSINRVQQLSLVHQARLAQVNRIATTVTAQSGANSPQAAAATAAVTATQAAVAHVSMLKQQVSAQAPAVTATGWALYGTVYNSSSAPVPAYSLYFVDSTNTYQSTFGVAYTGTDGSFQFVYAGPPAGQTAPTTPIFLQVANATGDPIYTGKTAFTPTPGVATYQTITLPAGEKPLGVLPTVLRTVTLPGLDKNIAPAAGDTDTTSGETKPNAKDNKG